MDDDDDKSMKRRRSDSFKLKQFLKEDFHRHRILSTGRAGEEKKNEKILYPFDDVERSRKRFSGRLLRNESIMS